MSQRSREIQRVMTYARSRLIRFIEAKTTEGGPETSFFLSPAELAFSGKNPGAYALYGVFDFDAEANAAKI
jgi:hypothetical protein